MRAHVAELDGRVVGIVHTLVHRATSRLADVCYLADLFTDPAHGGRGIAHALIQAVIDASRQAGHSRVYWTTHTTNATARVLYDRMAEHRGFIVYGHELGTP